MSPALALTVPPPLTHPLSSEAADVVRHLAHELRQPLSAIEATAFYLDIVLPRTDLRSRQQIVKLQQFVDQANWILTDALHYLLDEPPRPELLDLDELVAECVADLAFEGNVLHLRLAPEAALVHLDPGQGQHMIRNLLNIFRMFACGGHAITISSIALQDRIQMEVSCPAGEQQFDLASLFDPFCPHLPSGSGLALASARRIVESHGGLIDLAIVGNRNIQLTLTLPHPDSV